MRHEDTSLSSFQQGVSTWGKEPLEYLVLNLFIAVHRQLWQSHHQMENGVPTVKVEFVGTPEIFQDLIRQLVIIARFAHVDLELAVWQKFPNLCPYCHTKPCSCGPTKERAHEELNIPKIRSFTAEGLRQMLGEIYPARRARGREFFYFEGKIIEEAYEVIAALRTGTQREREDELADLFARLAELANHEGIVFPC